MRFRDVDAQHRPSPAAQSTPTLVNWLRRSRWAVRDGLLQRRDVVVVEDGSGCLRRARGEVIWR